MITTFEQSFTVHRYECDMHSRMLPAAILRRAQQISTDHCDTHGLTEDIYERTSTAFLLAKTLLIINKPITYGMKIKMVTNAYAPQRAVYCRTISFYCGEECMAQTDSRWILIDTQNKRILRRAPEELESFFPMQPPALEPFGIEKTKAQPVATLNAQFSMCDLNRHINNTVYADIVCNSIPANILESSYFKRLVLTYHSEIPYNTSFTLSMGQTESGFYFSGNNEGVNHFEANVYMN